MPRPCCLAFLGSHVPPLQPTPLLFFGPLLQTHPPQPPASHLADFIRQRPCPTSFPVTLPSPTPVPTFGRIPKLLQPACLPLSLPCSLPPPTSVPSHTLFPYWELSSSSPLPLAHAFGCPLLWKRSLTPSAGHMLCPCLLCSALLTPTLNLRFLAAALAGPIGGRKLCLTCVT